MGINLMGEIFLKSSVSGCRFDHFIFCSFDYIYVLCRHKLVRPAHMVHKILVFY